MSTSENVPKLVADFEYEDFQWLVVFWPDERDDPWQVYRADIPWYWKRQPYEDVRE